MVKETVVSNGKKILTVMKGGADSIDDNDSTVITAKELPDLETAEIRKASNIGTDSAATVDKDAGAADGETNTFTSQKDM